MGSHLSTHRLGTQHTEYGVQINDSIDIYKLIHRGVAKGGHGRAFAQPSQFLAQPPQTFAQPSQVA